MAFRKMMNRQVAEFGPWNRCRHPGFAANPEVLIERRPPQGDKDLELSKEAELLVQIGTAGIEFLLKRLVARRRAADRGPDVAVDEAESVVPMRRLRLGGKAVSPQGLIEPIAASITGKHPSRSVATMGGRGQAYDQKARFRVSKPRKWTPPVGPLPVLPPLGVSDLLPVGNEARALRALDDLVIQSCKRANHKP